jgi:hypothetical protein
MTADPKLPFDTPRAGVEDRSGSAETPSDQSRQFPATGENSNSRASTGTEERPFHRPTSALHRWMRRIGVLLFVFLCATVGVMLMIVPWRPEWSENPLALSYPLLHDIVVNGFTRGLVTGLGLMNVWIGFLEALLYRED